MSRADLSWRCPKCFNWIFEGDSCPHCGYTVPKKSSTKTSSPKLYRELQDDEFRLHIYWSKAFALSPAEMDRDEMFLVITDDGQKATIIPPYYESREIVVKRGRNYTLRFQSLYRGKVVHEYPYQLDVDKEVLDDIVIGIDRVPLTIKKLFRSQTVHIMKVEFVNQHT